MKNLGESTSNESAEAPAARMGRFQPREKADSPQLDDAQRQVVAHRHGPLLVLAGPGTGKTTTIVEAVVARMRDDDPPMAPHHIAVLTFGRAAAAELRDRISARLTAGQLPHVATFHSFAWTLLREFQDPELMPQRLLNGPDQDLMLRELLGDPSQWAQLWPEATRELLDSPALAGEMATFISAVRSHGWNSEDLRHAATAAIGDGQAAVPAEWPAAAAFFEHYLTILDMREAVDYAEAIHRATLLVQSDPRIAERFRMIYVDEYQDTDPAQVALVQALAANGASVVAVGDPDQAIYRFRGADVSGILCFEENFRTDDGSPAPVVVLDRTRRFGQAIREVAATWIEPVSMGQLPTVKRQAHRNPTCVGNEGQVDLLVSRSPEDQAAAVADVLRRARFDSEVPLQWSDMAVLVRSGVGDIPRLQRAFLHAGIPVEVPQGEVPIGQDPAVTPLLVGLRLAVDPEAVSAEAAATFLQSPLVGLTPLDIRRLQRSLRDAEMRESDRENRLPRPSPALVLGLLAGEIQPVRSGDADLDAQIAALLRVLTRARATGLSIAERLWVLWSDGGPKEGRWAQQLQRRALAGGIAGQRADAVLDVVVELFRIAERIPRGAGVGIFLDTLENQQFAAARSEDLGFTRDCVTLLTAHRAKGLQWPLVVVVGLQQDQWPMARNPATLLQADRLSANGIQPGRTRAELMDDERRLAYVAATRAQQRLVLSVVDSQHDGEAPSFLFAEAELVVGGSTSETQGVSARTRLNGAALVADLRTALTDPQSSPGLVEAAAARLAELAADSGGEPIVRQAHPRMWWGIDDLTEAPTALVEGALTLSATAAKQVQECSLKWFLERRMHANTRPSPVMAIGSLVHAAIKDVIDGNVAADVDVIMERLSPAWELLPVAEGWQREASLRQTRSQVSRFLRWWNDVQWQSIATEFAFRLDLPWDGEDEVVGSIDLIARNAEGGVTIVDFKTGKTRLSVNEAQMDVQLGLYQWAYAGGDPVQAADERVDGAQLVYLGYPAEMPSIREQSALTDDTWLLETFEQGAHQLRSERIVARRNKNCRTCSVRPHCPLWSSLDWPDAGVEPGSIGEAGAIGEAGSMGESG